jgi:hypothetical protein
MDGLVATLWDLHGRPCPDSPTNAAPESTIHLICDNVAARTNRIVVLLEALGNSKRSQKERMTAPSAGKLPPPSGKKHKSQKKPKMKSLITKELRERSLPD